MKKDREVLREGFSTGACAAAAAKAACLALKGLRQRIDRVSLPFPDGERRTMEISWAKVLSRGKARACVVKDAGDDPDVTHRAEIWATVEFLPDDHGGAVEIRGGEGVGTVTKPGLCVEPGQPAINPVPRRMIQEAVREAVGRQRSVRVTISVPDGERLAEKTLNARLGIVGGISILGTTGIVKPISDAAWCATISVSMDVALAAGLDTVCLSTGRSSEEAAMKALPLAKEAFVSMGDYVGFSLKEASVRPFRKVIMACQWSKLVKMAMGWDQTHVRFGPVDPRAALGFLDECFGLPESCRKDVNTVRQMFFILRQEPGGDDIVRKVCRHAYRRLAGFLSEGQALELMLVSYEKEIVHREG